MTLAPSCMRLPSESDVVGEFVEAVGSADKDKNNMRRRVYHDTADVDTEDGKSEIDTNFWNYQGSKA